MSETTRFSADYSKRLSKCKKCRVQIEKNAIRLAKIVANPFGDEGDMKQYYHVNCMFESFARVRATTKIIETADDIEDFQVIEKKDQIVITEFISSKLNLDFFLLFSNRLKIGSYIDPT